MLVYYDYDVLFTKMERSSAGKPRAMDVKLKMIQRTKNTSVITR